MSTLLYGMTTTQRSAMQRRLRLLTEIIFDTDQPDPNYNHNKPFIEVGCFLHVVECAE